MKVGDLVRHWMLETYGIGIIVEKEQRGNIIEGESEEIKDDDEK